MRQFFYQEFGGMFDGQRACNFTGVVATHTVGQNHQTGTGFKQTHLRCAPVHDRYRRASTVPMSIGDDCPLLRRGSAMGLRSYAGVGAKRMSPHPLIVHGASGCA